MCPSFFQQMTDFSLENYVLVVGKLTYQPQSFLVAL